MAGERGEARSRRDHIPLPPAIDALIQLEAADQLEAAGRHEEAVMFAANAVGEMPGNDGLLEWESRLVAGDHDPHFDYKRLLFGDSPAETDRTGTDQAGTDQAEEIEPSSEAETDMDEHDEAPE